MLVFMAAGWLQRSDLLIIDYLREENRVLREQLGRRRVRFSDDQRRRLAVRAQLLGRSVLAGLATVVSPDTLLRGYHQLVARKYDGSRNWRAKRPPTKADLAELVIQMARDNPTWGYTRIRGALHNLGHDLARSTIQAILADAGNGAGARAQHAPVVGDLSQSSMGRCRRHRLLLRRGAHLDRHRPLSRLLQSPN
jgi:putative transposase